MTSMAVERTATTFSTSVTKVATVEKFISTVIPAIMTNVTFIATTMTAMTAVAAAILVCSVDLGASFQQQVDALKMPILSCKMQWKCPYLREANSSWP